LKALNFCGVIAGVAVLTTAFSSISVAGSAPAVQSIEGGPIPAATRNDPGGPLPPTSNVAGASGNYYGGNNDIATSGVRERGVAGSGLPRENVSVVDTKSLRSKKIDGKFGASLLGTDFKSVKEVRAVTQKEASKPQSQTEKTPSPAKTSEQSKTQTSTPGDSTKAAETTASDKR
jgi:hypothetical protein